MNPVIRLLSFGAVVSAQAVLLLNAVWLFGHLWSRHCGKRFRYAPFGYASLGLVCALALALSYGYLFGCWNLCVREIEYQNEKLPPAFRGFRIVHISDLHLELFDASPDRLQDIVDAINAQKPDLVCFTGDLVSIGRSEAEAFTPILKSICARYGVVSVFGNHDFLIHNRDFKDDDWNRLRAVEKLAGFEREELGWTLLRNSSKTIPSPDGSKITIVGTDNKNCRDDGSRIIKYGDVQKAMENVDGFTVLLTHDPSHWDTDVLSQTDIPLTLSGHTHAAQFSLPCLKPASLMFKRSYGRYDVDGQTIYVNPGLGCTVPFRIGARPEITVITLK